MLRIGCGSLGEECRVEEAARLAESGLLQYLVFDRLSEWVTAHLHLRRWRDGQPAFETDFEAYLEELLPISTRTGVKILTNAGADDPEAALGMAISVCDRLGLKGVKIAAPRTSDSLDMLRELDPLIEETGEPLSRFSAPEVIGATVYFGAAQVVEGLDLDADVVIAGRVGDSALYLAPLVHEYKWEWDAWDLLARGMTVGHMLECGPQVTGGYYASPPYKIVPDLVNVGLPYAEVGPDGDAVITKLEDTGGLVSIGTCKEQLLYEVGDPTAYMHADVVVDLTSATLADDGPNRVRIGGSTGRPRPDLIKALITVREGFQGEGYIQFSGRDAMDRARLSAGLIRDRLDVLGVTPQELRLAYVGVNSTFEPWQDDGASPARDIMLHVAGRFETREEAELLVIHPSGALRGASDCYGVAGSMRARSTYPPSVSEIAVCYTAFVPRTRVAEPEVFVVSTGLVEREIPSSVEGRTR